MNPKHKFRLRELANYLGVSIHTLYKKVENNEIPFERLGTGRTLFFDLDAIDRHMRSQGNGDLLNSSNIFAKDQNENIADEVISKA